MVVVEKLSKTTHLVPVKSTYQMAQITDIFMKEIFLLHGMPQVVSKLYITEQWNTKYCRNINTRKKRIKQERHRYTWFTQFGLCPQRNNQSLFLYYPEN